METPRDSCDTFQRPLSLGAEEDQEQQHGGNAVVSQAGVEGAKKGLVLGGLAQGGLDQGELAQGEVAQEEPAQSSPTQEATGVGEEGEKQEEEMEERYAGDGASDPEDNNVQQGGQNRIDQQEQEEDIPEVNENQRLVNRLINQRYSRVRFTHSQLRDLERLFQETHYPSLRARKDLARWIGLDEYDVQNWFRMRRALFQRNRRLLMLWELPPLPQSDSP